MKLFHFFYVFFMLVSVGAQATSYTWNGSVSSAWSNPSNWTPNSGVPSATDDIVIVSAANVPQYNGVSGGCTNLTLTSGTLDLGSFAFTVSGNATFTLGTIKNGSFVVSGATTALFGSVGPIVFDCPVSITAQTMAVRNATFNNTVTLTKTGSSNDNSVGNNTFMGATTINNSGSGYFLFGSSSPDNFQGAVTVNNMGSSSVHLAYGSLGNTFGSTLTINQNSTGSTTNSIVSVGRGNNSSATIAGVTTFNGASAAAGSLIELGSGNGCNLQFNSAVNITQASTGTGDHDVSIANTSGTVVFNGAFTYINTSSGCNNSRFYIAESNSAGNVTFNGDFTYNSSSSAVASSYMRILRGNVAFNENIIVSSTATGAGTIGAYFGWTSTYTGIVTLASGKTVSIGADGFNRGTLKFENFKQLGATAQNITLTGTAALYSETNTVWNADVNFKAPQLYLNGATYNGVAILEKNGTTDNAGDGGNTFNGLTTITSSGSGSLRTGNLNADVFNAAVTFNNTGTHAMYIAYNHTGQTTTFASTATFNSNKTASMGSTAGFVIAESVGNVVFNGAVVFNVDGGGVESDIRLGNPAWATGISTLTFNDKLTVNVTNSNTITEVYLGFDKGICIFNEDVELTNTGGGRGIYFSSGSLSTCTLAAGKKVLIGAAGFNAGTLSIYRFMQVGSTAQAITLTGTASLILGTGSVWNGDVNFVSPQLYLSGATYNGVAILEKNGATDNAGDGGNTFNGLTTINNSGTGYLLTGYVNADAFNAAVTFNNTSAHAIYVAHNHTGQTTTFASTATFNANKTASTGSVMAFMIAESTADVVFNGDVVFNVDGGTIESDIRLGNPAWTGGVSTLIFNGKLTVNVTNSHPTTEVYLGYDKGVCNFNEDIELTNTGGSRGIYFSSGTLATCTLASGKKLLIGAAGFNTGTLSIYRFTQVGNTAQAITLTGAAVLVLGTSSVWNGDVNFVAPQLYLHGTIYNGVATLEKNGATDNWGDGGNTFNGLTTITNSGTGYLLTGGTNADAFNAAVTFNNTGAHAIYVAHRHTGQTTTFASDVVFNSNKTSIAGSSVAFFITEGNANVSFNGAVTFNILGAMRSDVRVGNNASANGTFNGKVTVNSNSSASTSITFGLSSPVIFNDNIEVTNTGLTNIAFGASSATSSAMLADGKTVTIGAAGFSGGSLSFIRFTQVGNTAQTLTLTGTALLTLGIASTWNANVDFKAPQLLLANTVYNGVTVLEKTGASDNHSSGGNTFNGVTTITNSGSGYLLVGGTNPDFFNAFTTFNNTGANAIYIAYSHSGQMTVFASDVVFNSNKTASTGSNTTFFITETAANIRFNGTVTFNILGAVRSDVRVGNGTGSVNTFMGKVTVNNSNTNASTVINLPINGTALFNDNIELTNVGGGVVPITFCNNASASATLADGKTITVGAAGFDSGTLNIYRFTQQGTTPQALTFTGTATLVVSTGTVWNGNVNFSAPNVYLSNTLYNGTSLISKTGSGANNSSGGNTFVGVSNIRNTASGIIRLANTAPDIFTTDFTADNVGSGSMELAYGSAGNVFGGTTTINNTTSGANPTSSIAVASGATATFAGTTIINNTPMGNSSTFHLGHNGATVTFNAPLTINHGATSLGSHDFYINSIGTGIYNADVVMNNTSTGGSNSRLYIGESSNSATTAFNGNFTFNNTSTATSESYLRILRGTAFFNGNINLTNTAIASASNGFLVGWSGYNGNAALADTKTFNVGTFNTGMIRLYRFTQLGTTPQNINLTGSARLEIGLAGYSSTMNGNLTSSVVDGAISLNGSTFNGSVSAITSGANSSMAFTSNIFNGAINYTSPSQRFTGNTFNGTVAITKTGTSNNDSNGGNIYNSSANFTVTNTGRLRLGSTAADDYNGNVTFLQNGTGLLLPAYTNASTFAGNISTIGSGNAITFSSSGGTVILDGAADQTWSGDVVKAPAVSRLTIATSNNSNLNLAVPLTISTTLTLTSGLINTSATNLLIMANGSAASSGNALSYVNGIMKKIGNTAFTFPVGAGGYWARLGMIPVSGYATTTEFTCQYYASAPANNANAAYMNPGITYASGVEYWDLKRVTAAGPTCQVTLYWENSVRSDLNSSAPSDLVVAHFSSSTNKWGSQGGSPASIPSAGSITSTSTLSSFSPITFGSIAGLQPLPIQLLSFDAQAQNSGEVLVKWITASELNNQAFVVERAADGRNFEAIGTIQGAGNSRETRNYSFLDQKALQAGAYYRLKQIDFDGAFTYSSIVKVSGSKATWAMYPNPVAKGQMVCVELGAENVQEVNLTVTDALGRVMLEKVLMTQGRILLNDFAILPEGVYVVRATAGNETFIQKLVIQ
ncbi:T9SS type A sorting domain-containing protein [Flexibacter flexilis]|nr:T9SS type A sorting domain-containing protein [Flexibacter flexilis]